VPTVLALGEEDWPRARAVRLRALADAPAAFTSDVEREGDLAEAQWRSRLRTGRWFVATEGSETVGMATGIPAPVGDERELVGMWVAPEWRQRGVARALVTAVAAWAREDGATRLTLGVIAGNEGARAAYLAMGLYATGEHQEWRDRDRPIEILALALLDGAGR
jgi:GNAT superfamily N-acetyltransferase